jgi:glyoxylase-like metal-dependent hydrolase (beta-lactamase superfamily II)
MKQITVHTDGIIRIKAPLPFPLRWINGYLIPGKDGYTLIDPGLRTEAAEHCWDEALQSLGLQWHEIGKIVLTHYHPDHYGLAGLFQERTGAPVFMSEQGHALAMKLWGEQRTMTRDLCALFRMHGMDGETVHQIEAHMEEFVEYVTPHPQVDYICPGDDVMLGDIPYRAILTPGHAAGHLCFYHEQNRILFCGDHVIPQISPNVSLLPGSDPNPLQSFLDSLQEMLRLDVAVAYPGHRDPFDYFERRVQELIDHHHERLNLMEAMLETPATAFEVCQSVFGQRLSIHQLRFAMSETLAHLVFLREEGRIVERSDGEVSLFSKLLS